MISKTITRGKNYERIYDTNTVSRLITFCSVCITIILAISRVISTLIMTNKLDTLQTMRFVKNKHSFSRSEIKDECVDHSGDQEVFFETERIPYKPRAAVFIRNTNK